VRTLINDCLATLLCTSMMGLSLFPARANASSAQIGIVLRAERAQLDADIVRGAEVVCDDDQLGTGGNGILRARLCGSQLYLRPSTSARVHRLANGFSADLANGTVVLASPEGGAFEVVVNGVSIRPATLKATTTEVTRVSPEDIPMTANRGQIQVSMDSEVNSIGPGTSYRMNTATGNLAVHPIVYHPGKVKNRLAWIILGGVIAAVTIGIIRALAPN
jgi:hypothetical protein